MGVGLGKNSPIVLQLSRDNFEGMIDRHGQWVRILNHNKCNCVLDSGYPDPNCPVCNGDGIYYTFQRVRKLYMQNCPVSPCENDRGIAEIPDSVAGTVTAVYVNGNKLADADYSIYDNRFIVSTKIHKWDSVNVNTEKQTALIYRGVIQASDDHVLVFSNGIETDFNFIPVDIVSVKTIEDATTKDRITVKRFERNLIFTEDAIEPGKEYSVELEYIEPLKVVIHSQESNKVIRNFLEKNGLDSAMSFSADLDVMRDDVVTLLYASKIEQTVIPKGRAIPEWFVAEIISVRDKETEYRNGIDFRLSGRNRIEWLGENQPQDGVNLSVKYKTHPSYRVAGSFQHEIRSAENQLLPRMVGLKLISSGGDDAEGIQQPVESTTGMIMSVDDAAREYFEGMRD